MVETKAKTSEDIKGMLSHEIRSAITYDREDLSESRAKALKYFLGEMEDTPAPPNRSKVVSKDVSDVIGWMLPGIIRTFTASGSIVECEPVGPDDEEGARQASDYLHYLFMSKNDGYRILYEATHDSLLMKNGIVKTWWDDAEETEISEHTGLTDDNLAMLLSGDDIEVLAHSSNVEEQEAVDPQTGQPVMMQVTMHDVKIKRVKYRGCLRFDVVEPEDFGMNREATSIDDARFTFHREEKTRSELIEMGFDKETVYSLPSHMSDDWSQEELAREDYEDDDDESKDDSTTLIEVFECYLKTDADGDGVAETVRAYYAGGYGSGELLDWEIWEDDPPFNDIPCQPVPHRWDAISVADETMDLQQIKTALTRQMLDNVYAHNNPQPEVEEGSVLNMQSLVAPKFGQPIIKKRGAAPINWQDVPFIADKSLAAIEHINQVIERRTGVSRSTMALDPDALQNQTATAVQKTQDAAYSKIELIARNQAELGWKKVFKKALKIVTKHQNRAEIIRLRGKWVEMDPRHWNSDMDITVNVGLGTGSRDRDMSMLNMVLQNQMGLMDRFAGTGMVKQALQMLPKVVQTMTRIGEAAGLRNADDYYPQFGPQELQEMMQMAGNRTDPKVEAEKAKVQMQMQAKQAEMQMDGEKQQADMQMKREEAQMDAQLERQKADANLQLEKYQTDQELALKERQLVAEIALKERQMAAEMAMKERLGLHSTNVNAATSQVRVGGEPG